MEPFEGVMNIQGLNFLQKKNIYREDPPDDPANPVIVTVPLKNAYLKISSEKQRAVGFQYEDSRYRKTMFSKMYKKQGNRAYFFLPQNPNLVRKYTFTSPKERLTFLVGTHDDQPLVKDDTGGFGNPFKFPIRRLTIVFIHEILVDGKYVKQKEYVQQFGWSVPPHPFDKFRYTLEDFLVQFNEAQNARKATGRELVNLRKVVGLSETLTQIGYVPPTQDFEFPDAEVDALAASVDKSLFIEPSELERLSATFSRMQVPSSYAAMETSESRKRRFDDLVAAEFSRRVEREPTVETVREFRNDLAATVAVPTKAYELPADVMSVVGSFLTGKKGTLAMQSEKLKYNL